MSPIVSIVSLSVTFPAKAEAGFCHRDGRNYLNLLCFTLRCQTVDAGALEQIGELLAGIEHPGLHRALGNPDNGTDLLHRLLVVVDEVDDLAMRRRQFADAGGQDGAGGAAVERGFWRVGLVGDLTYVFLVDVLVAALA